MSFKTSASTLALLAAVALAGCETTGSTETAARNPGELNGLPDAPLGDDALSQAAYWGARSDDEPENAELAVRFSSALRAMGSHDQAYAVMARTLLANPMDAEVLTEYSRVLIGQRRGGDALQPLAQAIARDPTNWKLYSLEGVAHDQVGDYASATQSYEQALGASPNNPSVLNNYALSRALDGDPEGAESLLRAAIAEPGATVQMRQNLALVLGLQGKFEEAERYSRADLPPEAVNNNVSYYRAMLTQPATWGDLESPEELPSP